MVRMLLSIVAGLLAAAAMRAGLAGANRGVTAMADLAEATSSVTTSRLARMGARRSSELRLVVDQADDIARSPITWARVGVPHDHASRE